jgi:hypothetical protein
MKHILILAFYVAAVCALSSCATDDTTASSSGEKVPGETKSTEESRLQPGVGAGPNASVKW